MGGATAEATDRSLNRDRMTDEIVIMDGFGLLIPTQDLTSE